MAEPVEGGAAGGKPVEPTEPGEPAEGLPPPCCAKTEEPLKAKMRKAQPKRGVHMTHPQDSVT